MRLYSGSSKQFVKDSIQNQIADKLKSAFISYNRYEPSPNEYRSWQHSLRSMAQVMQYAELNDNGVILEYQLPQSSKRLDCMLTGRDAAAVDNAVIVELKQWETCEPSDGENEVATWVGGRVRDVLHPSAQVGQYRSYLADTHTAFYEGPTPVQLRACAYLHNYTLHADDILLSAKYQSLVQRDPLFAANQLDDLSGFLVTAVSGGDGLSVLDRVDGSRYRPSKKLMEHVSGVIKGNKSYVLLDEQLVVFDKVLAAAKAGYEDRRKRVLIIHGGPGTGKSVIALNLMAELLARGFNAHYATGSKAFTETLRKIIGVRGSVQFKYFNSYAQAQLNDVDVLICDEAHRIRETSNNRFTSGSMRSNLPQIEELLRVAKVSVFFIDDDQIVRPNELGSADMIRDYAVRFGCETADFELEAQFRCNGSNGFVNWVSNTLGVRSTANVLWTGHDGFDFQIMDSPEALDAAIRQKAKDRTTHSARLAAGFCWPWSKPNADGSLVDDVEIGAFKRPWNARSDAGRLAAGIPKESLWAYDPRGIEQVGCIYTAQGFEFDYVGVIWGLDLRYDLDAGRWVGERTASFDTTVKRSGEEFVNLVKNTYRVLLTRGLKGCYVYFMDKDTERYVRTRMEAESMALSYPRAAEDPAAYRD